MADISQIKLPSNVTYDIKDTVARNDIGVIDYPYQEVEWVESNGRQYVYLNWKPPINTWGFAADFLCKNAFSTTVGAWAAATNVNGYGAIFGTNNADNVNDVGITTYGSTGTFKIGGSTLSGFGLKTDKTRQQMSLIGTTLTKPNGTTTTVTRVSETANKPYSNMTVFGKYSGLRKSGTGTVSYPSTTRIYSLKFYEGTTVVVDLVGAIRIKDGMTGLYDKIEKHFYPAPGMTYGDTVGGLGDKETVLETMYQKDVQVVVNNYPNTRLFRAEAPQLNKLEDGQQISVTFLYSIGSSTQTTELAGWDDTTSNSNVYLKLTLADDTTTEWIPCYYSATGRLTTHYASGAPMMLTYRENVLTGGSDGTGGSIIVRAFYCEQNYDTNTVDRVRDSYFRPYAGEAIYRYKFVLQGADHRVYPIVTTNQTNGTQVAKVPTTVGLRPGRIWWYNTTTTKNAGALLDANTLEKVYQTTTSVYNFNTDIATYRTVYLRGTYNKDTDLFTLYNDGSSPCTSYYTQVPNNTANITLSSYFVSGYYYMLLGASYSSTNYLGLFAYNPLYYFDGTNLVPVSTKVAQDITTTSISGKIDTAGTGLSKSGTTLNHSNSVTAQTTQAIYPIKIDAQGHISAYGSAVTPLTSSSTLNAAKLSGAIPSAVTATTQTAGDNSTKIATTAFVSSAISSLPTSMQFIGTVGTNGTVTWANLATAAAANKGYTYKVITAHTAETGKPAAKAGDTIVSNGSEWIVIPSGDETATQSATTGISVADHSTTSIYGVSSSTTSVTGVSGSTSVYGVKSGTNSTTTASKASGANGTASSWTFESKTIPNVTAAGSGSASLTFTMDTTDTKKLKIAFSHTHTAPTLGTAITVQSKSGGSNGTAPTWSFTDVTVPIRADSATTVPTAASSATTVPIKNGTATTVVTSKTHSVTDNGHTHTI